MSVVLFNTIMYRHIEMSTCLCAAFRSITRNKIGKRTPILFLVMLRKGAHKQIYIATASGITYILPPRLFYSLSAQYDIDRHLPAISAIHWGSQKNDGNSSSHVNPQSIAVKAYLDKPITKGIGHGIQWVWISNPLDSMSYTPLTVLLTPAYDCVAFYLPPGTQGPDSI